MSPPKSTAKAVDTIQIEDVIKKLEQSGTPTEEEFKVLLAGMAGDSNTKKSVLRFIPQYVLSFPKLTSSTFQAIRKLTQDKDPDVRFYVIPNLPVFLEIDKSAVVETLMNVFGDPEERIVNKAENALKKIFADSEIQGQIYSDLGNKSEEAQNRLVIFIAENAVFTEENKGQLVEILKVAFSSSVIQALELLSKNRTLISDELKEEFGNLVASQLSDSLQNNFQAVSEFLLIPITSRMKLFGDSTVKKIVNFIPDLVFPNFRELKNETAIAFLRKMYQVRKFIVSENFQEKLYEHVILSFPAAGSDNPKFNFSIIEATLALFHSLSTQFSIATGNLIGKPLIVTFQPSELSKIKNDEGRYRVLTSRLELITSNATIFVQKYKDTKANLKSLGTLNDSQISDVRLASDAIATGNNCLHYARILQGENFTKAAPPQRLSWVKQTSQNSTPGNYKNGSRSSRSSPRDNRNNFNKFGRNDRRSPQNFRNSRR